MQNQNPMSIFVGRDRKTFKQREQCCTAKVENSEIRAEREKFDGV